MKILKWLMCFFVGLLTLSMVVVFCTHFFIYLKSQKGTEVTLQMLQGMNIKTCSGWKGEHFCPASWGFGYKISHVDPSSFDSSLQSKVMDYFNPLTGVTSSEHVVVYVPLVLDEHGYWYIKGLITANRQSITSPVFIKGTLNGNNTYDSVLNKNNTYDMILKEVGISYPQIESSLDIAPFTDFGFVSPKSDNVRAVVVLGKDGDASFKAVTVDNKVCISAWRTVDLKNEDCWGNYMNSSSGAKMYSSIMSFPMLLTLWVIHFF